jgi:L-threonylcarbamoyladenylate synthase
MNNRRSQTRLLRAFTLAGEIDGDAIEEAARILRSGGLVAFPTETVYGLGADATNPDAVAGIFTAKERPYSDPLIVHLAGANALPQVVAEIPGEALVLAERFWPGPLTLILPRAEAIPPVVAAGGATIGVRVPAHPVALALLRAADVPVAAPSANRFMHTSPTTAEHVLADLDGRIDCVLDAGPTAVGVESTVLDTLARPPRILRPGGVTLETLREVLPDVQGPAAPASPAQATAAHQNEAVIALAPGQLERHYAPRTRLIVFDAAGGVALAAIRAEAEAALARGERVGALLPDDEADALALPEVTVARLGSSDDLPAISRSLYAALRALDAQHLDTILTHTFGMEGLGLALWDRLRRAAGGQMRTV